MRDTVRRLYAQIAGKALQSLLPNFINDDDGDVAQHFDAAHAARLANLRKCYDQNGLFGAA